MNPNPNRICVENGMKRNGISIRVCIYENKLRKHEQRTLSVIVAEKRSVCLCFGVFESMSFICSRNPSSSMRSASSNTSTCNAPSVTCGELCKWSTRRPFKCPVLHF